MVVLCSDRGFGTLYFGAASRADSRSFASWHGRHRFWLPILAVKSQLQPRHDFTCGYLGMDSRHQFDRELGREGETEDEGEDESHGWLLSFSSQTSVAVEVAGYPVRRAHLGVVADRAVGGYKGTVQSTEFDGADSREFKAAVTR